jgi:hypothetical protein
MPSIGVLEANQKPTEKPTRRIKRSGGQSLVNRGLAIWLKDNVLLQMFEIRLPVNSAQINGSHCREHRVHNYIPEKLPANIDHRLGLTVQAPVLANQVRFRPVADQRSFPAY